MFIQQLKKKIFAMKQSENLGMMCLKTIKTQTYKINILFTIISFIKNHTTFLLILISYLRARKEIRWVPGQKIIMTNNYFLVSIPDWAVSCSGKTSPVTSSPYWKKKKFQMKSTQEWFHQLLCFLLTMDYGSCAITMVNAQTKQNTSGHQK